MPFSLVLGCDRPLVGVDAENSEVVQETPHPSGHRTIFLRSKEFFLREITREIADH